MNEYMQTSLQPSSLSHQIPLQLHLRVKVSEEEGRNHKENSTLLMASLNCIVQSNYIINHCQQQSGAGMPITLSRLARCGKLLCLRLAKLCAWESNKKHLRTS